MTRSRVVRRRVGGSVDRRTGDQPPLPPGRLARYGLDPPREGVLDGPVLAGKVTDGRAERDDQPRILPLDRRPRITGEVADRGRVGNLIRIRRVRVQRREHLGERDRIEVAAEPATEVTDRCPVVEQVCGTIAAEEEAVAEHELRTSYR